MPIIGLLRIKNEARWIDKVVRSITPICERVLILDDHSTDDTPYICKDAGAKVFHSHFVGCDESRDKDFLLSKAYEYVPDNFKRGVPTSPYWALLIDGDEELVAQDQKIVFDLQEQEVHSWSLRILYLWNTPIQIRVDGVYRTFRRPSMFRLMNEKFRFMQTPFGSNFHCSSIPQEMIHHSGNSEARLLHYGYMHRADRMRKYEWYNQMDPNNIGEDYYRHVIQGDVPEIPDRAKLRHAGPLELEAL